MLDTEHIVLYNISMEQNVPKYVKINFKKERKYDKRENCYCNVEDFG